ncbi:adenylate/guanylate cyclase domain-containing protein [Micromonospora mirobrigensis]|uniref:AAA ATPase domain-containing protein n=1 Tax=Micromonospora mirobrigensis TaxID=262898 RepID=A0A1C4WLQ7_9ACTN|nr:adenylate/guanylate cyclase domain-containing protein [Micromonospora mirobrigensis]SCE96821.1 AAA ATPase domain-containing protein [Micromonospora mirobrigensis]
MSTLVTGPEPETPIRWPAPEERRTVSVLFADIVGSTSLVERLDPEDVRALQHDYFDTVAVVLRRWGGTVEKYVGDAVMALFGADRSDGFDAYRAVRAGLEIQRMLDGRPLAGGWPVRIRVGVATGEVLVDVPATRDGAHGTASGAVITTAARLQEYAPPGAVALCPATHRATVDLIEQRPLASTSIAGRTLPLWRAVGTVAPRRGRHQGPLVGRRRELATAGDEIVRALRDRRPARVALVGPTGSGRSRLLHELTRTLSTVDGAPVRWIVAHCPPYPEQPLAPLAALVRDLIGVREGEPPAAVRRRLAEALDGLLPAALRATAVPALADLLAAAEGAGTAGHGSTALRQVLLALAAGQPVVVAVDDPDRAGPALDRFLRVLLAEATLGRAQLAVVTTHGPDRADPLPAGDRVHRVALPALGAVETGRLLRHLLDRAGRPAALARLLVPLVGGNPGVADAYVRSLAEDGAVTPGADVPERVRRIADARLDRLDGGQRAVLAAATVLGTGVTGTAVDRLLGWSPGRAAGLLRLLVAVGLLRRSRRGGHLLTEPVLGRVAHGRLPRPVRAELARRARRRSAVAPTGPAVAPADLTTVPDGVTMVSAGGTTAPAGVTTVLAAVAAVATAGPAGSVVGGPPRPVGPPFRAVPGWTGSGTVARPARRTGRATRAAPATGMTAA